MLAGNRVSEGLTQSIISDARPISRRQHSFLPHWHCLLNLVVEAVTCMMAEGRTINIPFLNFASVFASVK